MNENMPSRQVGATDSNPPVAIDPSPKRRKTIGIRLLLFPPVGLLIVYLALQLWLRLIPTNIDPVPQGSIYLAFMVLMSAAVISALLMLIGVGLLLSTLASRLLNPNRCA
jgi:hypothetical protein